MNIGIDISPLASSFRSGVGEYTYELLKALFAIDKKNQYFLFLNAWNKKQTHEFFPPQKNVHLIRTYYPNKIFHAITKIFHRPFLDTLIVKEYEKKHHVKIGHLNVFFSPNIGFVSLSSHCKNIFTIHDLSFELFPQCFSLKMRLWHAFLRPKNQCENSDLILVPSQSTKRDIEEQYGISPEKIKVLPLGVSSVFEFSRAEVHQVRHKYGLPEKFILFLGTLEPRKNIEGIIEAYRLFGSSRGYELIIAGGKGWKYKKILKKIEDTPGVRYIGYVDPKEKPALFRAASVFVFPSFYEGFGLPVLEAFQSGVPVITSDRSSLPELTDGAAALVNPHLFEEIQVALERILSDEPLKKNMIQTGKERAKDFVWEKSAREFLDILQKFHI